MDEKGIIKYHCHWNETKPIQHHDLDSLILWRDKAQSKGFIGVYS